MQDIGNLNWQYPVADNLLKGINIQNFPKFNALNNLFNPQSKIENTTGVKFKPSINGSPSQTYLGNTDFSNMVSQNWKSLNPAQQRMLSGTANFFDTGVGKITGSAISGVTSLATDKLTDELFGDSQFASLMGNIFSRGSHAAIDTMTNNLIKGNSLTEGLKQNVGDSVSGAVAGIAGDLVGQGINALGGDSKLSRGIGQGVSTVIGMVGANALSNVLKGEKAFKGITDSISAIKDYSKALKEGTRTAEELKSLKSFSNASKLQLGSLGATVVGTGLQAALGKSKEYNGKYGDITRGMDTAYDMIQAGVGFVPGWGQAVSAAMALNKGLSNLFGSTDAMTKQDAILGSAFMPAPVKWLNMAGAKSTGSFYNQSWQNTERTNAFMENAFGNLSKRFDLARNEAGKTYGTFSKSARKKAQRNLDFANNAWNTILAMTDLDELQRIRSQSMSSINNQRYALMIQGGFDPIYRGKQGMKIFNNATNHNIGMRLLSGAALIDNKQMILSALGGMSVPKKAKRNKYRDETDEPSMLELWKNETLEETLEEERRNTELLQRAQEEYEREMAARKAEGKAEQKEREQKFAEKRARMDAANTRFHRSADVVQTALLQSVTPPFTGKDYQEAVESQRQKKVEKFHEAEKIAEATLMADLAVSATPLLLRGFRWAFNKAGLLVKIPNKNFLKGFNFNDLPQEKYVYNNKTGDFDVIVPKKEWIRIGENDLVPDYFVSPLEKERLIATGISPEEALDIMDVRWINSIEALPGKLRNLGKNIFGDAQNINGRAFVRYNSRKGAKASLNNASTTLNTVFHELGGHGSSLNIGYGTQTIPVNMKDILMKIYKHNESLRPLLKPFYQAIKDGNFDLAKNLAKDEGIELSSLKGSSGDVDFKSLKDFIEYMEENLEYSARAIGSNMSNHYGMPNGWNEKQLRDIFTKESVDNLIKNVWNYGVPVTIGGSTAATLYNTNK